MSQINLIAPAVPVGPFQGMAQVHVRGGLHVRPDNAGRDAIPGWLRENGFEVSVLNGGGSNVRRWRWEGTAVEVQAVSAASPAVITTKTSHGLTTGDAVTIAGVIGDGAVVNGVNRTVTVLGPTTFTCAVNSSGEGAVGWVARNGSAWTDVTVSGSPGGGGLTILDPISLSGSSSDTALADNTSGIVNVSGSGTHNLNLGAGASNAIVKRRVVFAPTSTATVRVRNATPSVILTLTGAGAATENAFEFGKSAAGWQQSRVDRADTFLQVTVNGAGNTDAVVSGPTNILNLIAEAGGGAYTHTITVPAAPVKTPLYIFADIAPSANPTIEVRNLTTGGTLLLDVQGTTTSRTLNLALISDGTNWVRMPQMHVHTANP